MKQMIGVGVLDLDSLSLKRIPHSALTIIVIDNFMQVTKRGERESVSEGAFGGSF